MNGKVGLVACSAQKLPHRAAARDLYCSPLFKLSRSFVESACDQWFVLSALHGLLDPTTEVDPYNQSLTGQTLGSREVWGYRVFHQLHNLKLSNAVFVTLAGSRYTDPLKDLIALELPLAGMGIGQQLQWLTSFTRTLRQQQPV